MHIGQIIIDIVIPIFVGFVSIFLHTLSMVIVPGKKQSFTLLNSYIKDNVLTLTYSLIAYVLLIVLWYFEGLELAGFVKGKLTFATMFIGFGSQMIFDKVMYAKTQVMGSNNNSNSSAANIVNDSSAQFPVDPNVSPNENVDEPNAPTTNNQPQ